MKFGVYLPPAYGEHGNLPAVFFLSGGCNIAGEDDSYDFGTGAGFYLNATQEPWSAHYHMYDYVTKELPTLIEKNFKVLPEKFGLMGHSMGGHGALVIGLREANRFVSVSAFSPITHPSICPWGTKAFTGYLGADADWSMYDAVELITKHKKHFARAPLIDQGDSDEFLEKQLMSSDLEKACAAAGQGLTLRYQKGYDHSYFFISTFIEDHLNFHAKNLSE